MFRRLGVFRIGRADRDNGPVALAAAGHRNIDARPVRNVSLGDDQQRVVNSAALTGMGGLGVAEFEMVLPVVRRQIHRACRPLDGGGGRRDLGDGEGVAVAHPMPSVGDQASIVLTRHDQIANSDLVRAPSVMFLPETKPARPR